MNFLVTNDDGIESIGIKILVAKLNKFGNVYVVAPYEEQSAVSNALTVRGKFKVQEHNMFGDGIKSWKLEGTPTDCIKFAIVELKIKPDIVFSGINNGLNLGTDILYSGTVGGATEANIMGIPSVSFSGHEQNIEETEKLLTDVIADIIKNKWYHPGITLNINFPNCKFDENKGYKLSYQGYKPHDTVYTNEDGLYESGGKELFVDQSEGSDVNDYLNNYITITPLKLDRTDYNYLKNLENIIK